MKALALALLATAATSFIVRDDECPHDQEVECITDVNHGKFSNYIAFEICDKAAKAKGKDQSADIMCVQYMAAVNKDCWPCICKIAKDNDFKIKGCN